MIDNFRRLSWTTDLRITAAYYVSFIGLGLVSASLGPTLPHLAELTGVSLAEVGSLFLARSLGFLFGAIVSGRLYDRLRGHRLFAAFGVLMVLMMGLTPLVPILWLLIGVMFLTGFGQGGVDLGGNTMLVWVHREKVDPYMNGLHFIWGVGAFLAPVLVAQVLLLTDDLRWAYWLLAMVALPSLLWTARLPSPQPVEEKPNEDGGTRGFDWMLALLTLYYFGIVGVEMAYAGWIYTYAIELNLMGETGAAYLTSAFFGAFTLARLVGIPLATRLTPTQILLGCAVICVVSLAIILPFPSSVPVLWVGTIGMGVGQSMLFPMMLAWVQRRTPLTSRMTSWFFIGGSLGAMLVPWSIGLLLERQGVGSMVWINLVGMVVTLVILVELVRGYGRVGEQSVPEDG